MSKPFRITLAIIAMLVVLATTAIAVMSTAWFRRALERRLIVALEEMTGGRVEVQEFRFHPLALQAVFRGLVLHGSEPASAPALFSARTIVLRLSPANLLHREIRIMSLDWDGAEAHLRTNADGSTNLPGPLTTFQAGEFMGELIDLRIGRVTLARSTFFWDDQPLTMDLSARGVALLVRFRSHRRYEGSLVASAVTLQKPGHTLPPVDFSVRFNLSQNELAVTSLTWQARGISGGGSFTFHPVPEPEAYFSFQTSMEVAALNPPLRPPGLQNGNLRVEGQGIYRHGEISARGQLHTRRMLLRDAQFDSGPLEISADFSADQSRVAISNLKVLGWGGSVEGEGQVSLAGRAPEFHLRARLQRMNLSALVQSSRGQPRLFAQLHPASLLDGAVDVTWTGEFDKLKSQFDLHLSSPAASPAGFLPVSGDVKGSLDTNHGLVASLADSSLRTPRSLLRAKGTLVESTEHGESPGHLQIELETTQFEEWRSLLETQLLLPAHFPLSLESTATLAGDITGSRTNPGVRGSVRVGKFDYRGGTWDSLRANFAASPNLLQVTFGQLSRGGSLLTFQASTQLEDWRISKAAPVQVSARAQRTPLEGLKAVLGIDYPVGGEVSGQVSMTGTDSNLEGSGAIKVERGTLAGETFSSFSARIRIESSSLDLETIELTKGHGRITGSAQVDILRRSIVCHLHGADFSIADFGIPTIASQVASTHQAADTIPVSAPSGHESQPSDALGGQANFDLEGSGSPDQLHFRSTAFVKRLSVGTTPIGDLRIQLDGQGRSVQFHGLCSGPAGSFNLSGDAQMGGGWPLRVEGQYVSFRVDPWVRVILNGDLDAEVTASGSFKVDGSLQDASKLDLQSKIDTLEVSFPSLKWTNEHPVEVRYADNRLTAEPFRMQGPSTNLDIVGSLRLAGPASLSFTLQGVADATILSLFEPGLQASGQSRIKLNVSGSPARPQLNGVVDVRDVGLDYPGMPIRLSSLNGEIQFDGERATLKSLRGISGGGTIILDGFATLALPPRVQLRAKLDQVRAHYPADFTSILSGSLSLEGTADRSQLHGDLSVNQVVASESKPWLNQFMQTASPFESLGSGTTSSLANSVRLNIRVTSPTPVRLQVQDLRLTADIDVRLQGSLANPVEVGSVHFRNGEATVRGIASS